MIIWEVINFFDKKERLEYLGLFVLILISALTEMLGLSLLYPIMIMIIGDGGSESEIPISLLGLFSFDRSSITDVTFLSGGVILFFVAKSIFLTAVYRIQFKVVYSGLEKYETMLFEAYLKKPYEYYFNRNTSELIRSINVDILSFFEGLLLPLLRLGTDLMMVIFIMSYMFYLQPVMTGAVVTIACLISIIGIILLKHKAQTHGAQSIQAHGDMIKWVNQGFGAIKEIKVKNCENYFIEAFSANALQHAQSRQSYLMLSQTPKLFVEAIGASLFISVVVWIKFSASEVSSLITYFAILSIAAYKILPVVIRANTYLNSIYFSYPSFKNLCKDLSEIKELNKVPQNSFEAAANEIRGALEMKDIEYRYPGNDFATLAGINLRFESGKFYGIIGPSGAGKTTLIDLLLGLLTPTKGDINNGDVPIGEYIKKGTWGRCVSYVQQNVFLLDGTIRENIALGVPSHEVDDEQISKVLAMAQLDSYISNLPEGVATRIGELGIKISGGQKQRIGIARALYGSPNILVLDEATASLDSETENEILTTLESLKGQLTILMITHRVSTTLRCDEVVKIGQSEDAI